MPFCTQCGTEVQDIDQFCSKCGARQSGSRPVPPQRPPGTGRSDPLSGMSDRKASVLCYIPFVGWLAAIVVLASNRFRHERTVRFHAFQGLYLFVGWLLIEWVVGWMFLGGSHHVPIVPMLKLGMVALWIFMLIKTSQDQFFSLPIVGELAERSLQ
ncbi:MAG TPA: zinc-ribbon domain-containing protein [Bryobacteraceae bacterium]|nr:zinc-ribbon domain-containing protein [Bryobacteraceae bacterium]